MMLRLRALALIACLWGGAAAAHDLKAWAYVAWWLPDGWKSLPMKSVERLLFFQIEVQPQGTLEVPEGWPENWTDMLSTARAQGKPVDLTLTLLNRQDFSSLFSSPPAITRLLNEAVALANQPLVSGLHLDVELYEAFPPAQKIAYQGFVRELARRLHQLPQPRTLSAFVPMGGPIALYTPQTLALLDDVVMQAYDVHWQESTQAGPVAPLEGKDSLTWRKAVSQADRWGIPRKRVHLSFPLYGYEWTVDQPGARSAVVGNGETVSYSALPIETVPAIQINVEDRVRRYGARYETASGSAYYEFKDAQGRLRVGWFEDAKTLDSKIDFLQSQRIGGIAFFLAGYDDGHLVRHFARRQTPSPSSGP